MNQKFRLYLFSILAAIATLLSIFVNQIQSDHSKEIVQFQKKLTTQVDHLNSYLWQQHADFVKSNWSPSWKNVQTNEDFYLHYFRNDSLVLWSHNDMPISRFTDIHFPSEGIVHLQNGWYYSKIIRSGKHLLCSSFLIKRDYPYENEDLKNNFAKAFELSYEASISLEQINGCEIRDLKGNFLFSVVPNDVQNNSELVEQLYLILYASAFCFWLIFFLLFYQTVKSKLRYLIPVALIVAKVLLIYSSFIHFKVGVSALDPSLYGANKWFPNYFEYLTNIALIIFLLTILNNELKKVQIGVKTIWISLLLILPFWMLIRIMTQGLVENSSIPLSINKVFSVNLYTLLALLSIGGLMHSYYLILKTITKKLFDTKIKLIRVFAVLVTFHFSSIIILGITIDAVIIHLLIACFSILTTFQSFNKNKRLDLGLAIGILLIAVVFISLLLYLFNIDHEQTNRELYANQLSTEQNVVTELEYGKVVENVQNDPILTRFISTGTNLPHSEFEEGLERRIFNGFWERYEMNFYLYNEKGESVLGGEKSSFEDFAELNELIKDHGRSSEIDTNIYYITDNIEQYSYVIRQEIVTADSLKNILFITLRSKKIPEEIGFPRLLISSKADVLESLENYSIAKYHNGKLVVNYGSFTYPSSFEPIKRWRNSGLHFKDYADYRHYVQRSNNGDVLVLSSIKTGFIDFVSSFSYLFIFFGTLLLPRFFRFHYGPIFKKTLSLAIRIQVILIGLVFLSLFAFSWGSGVFVRNQYNQFSNNVVTEKLHSIELELKVKIGNRGHLSIEENGNSLETVLEKLSKVFKTDINLYDDRGFLIATSRSKLFNIGLISEQMNPKALYTIKVQNKSRFIQDENIGDLSYASAYLPYFNQNNQLIGFLNLQHFGQQKEFEDQIQQFLVSIINVFMLLLVLSVIAALLISNWLTAPLRIIQDNFAKLRFGEENAPIIYEKEDEIGALVKAYNSKLEELEFTAGQLAKSERESAWREMAKQVAHEIKNPLTPMKLSVQQMMRVFDPTDPSSAEKLKKVTASIIEQIDALTLIANEFSNFAKMPLPQESTFDLIPLIANVIEVFREESGCVLEMNSSLTKAEITADKDQMIRVFNNLIKNAIQSIPSEKSGRIHVALSESNERWLIEITDNGIGIPETERDRIFVPYFTTKSTGTGIGLAMIKQIIENHHGAIYFNSQANKGTTFSIELPKKI
ncbi:MAG: ATP-binding protein [Flavobacteriia bacterium]|jgi:signal transduction histidine kinase